MSNRTQNAPRPDTNRPRGLLGLTAALIGHHRLDKVVQLALDELSRLSPGTAWAILERTSSTKYHASASGCISASDVDTLGRIAIGPDVDISHDVALGERIPWGRPQWCEVPGRHDEAAMVLAVWTMPGGQTPMWYDLNLAAQVIAAAVAGAREVEAIRYQTARDELTRVSNRKGIIDALENEKARAARYGQELSVLFIDLDKFKAINDQLGHAVGDAALVEVAQILEKAVRTTDHVGRFGGDEFLIVLPETNLEAAELVASRIKDAVSCSNLTADGQAVKLSVTVGASSIDESTQEDIVEIADRRMLALKKKRRWGRISRKVISLPNVVRRGKVVA